MTVCAKILGNVFYLMLHDNPTTLLPFCIHCSVCAHILHTILGSTETCTHTHTHTQDPSQQMDLARNLLPYLGESVKGTTRSLNRNRNHTVLFSSHWLCMMSKYPRDKLESKDDTDFKIIQKATVHQSAQEMQKKAMLYYFKQAEKRLI